LSSTLYDAHVYNECIIVQYVWFVILLTTPYAQTSGNKKYYL